MKAKLLQDMGKFYRDARGKKQMHPPGHPEAHKAGTVVEGHNVYLLVRHGAAEAADEECAKAAGMTPESSAAAKKAYEKVSKGIHPEDYEAFDAGLMRGYKPDGKEGDTWIPGPKHVPGCEEEYYESQQEEDDE